MWALSYIVADCKEENMELAQLVKQLVDDYNEVGRQLNGKETRKDEDPAKLLLGNMQKMFATICNPMTISTYGPFEI